ncbi:hypothetical protein GNX71_25760 [Variovorax sp. RKNM96]|uniref:hypothetical protein n=1 Tax=Variovorax sp. RKNM96 TaxID=2681552 RepID=UPI0019815F34|nr:hypothetical protein [Variovorax sp. RKNM96]QSI32794.1 hypothetical protein GNX71_25760 [Variovorax sp. RKNM96]
MNVVQIFRVSDSSSIMARLKMKNHLVIFMLMAVGASSPLHAQSSKKSFIVTQTMSYKGGVDVSEFGVLRSPIIYEASLLPSKVSDQMVEGGELKDLIDGVKIGPVPLVIDIERWPLYTNTENERSKNREKLIKVLDSIRAVRPGIKLGYYSLVPARVYFPLIDQTKGVQKQMWKKSNDQALDDFVSHVDAIFPSLYTLYDDQDGWEKYAEQTLQDARRFGKPVYCYLWPQYHSSNQQLRGEYLSAKYWGLELETCYKYADGVVIWNHEPEKKWDPNVEWWQQTLKFLKSHSIKN